MVALPTTARPWSRSVRIRLAAAFVYRFVSTMAVPFMAIFLVARLGAYTGGVLMVAVAVAGAAATVLGGPLCDRWGRRPMLILGELGAASGFAGAAVTAWYSGTPGWIFTCFIIATALSALALPSHDATIVDITTAENRKIYYTLNYWSINVAIGIGSLLGGYLYATHFPAVLLGCGLALAMLGAVTIAWLPETRPVAERSVARSGVSDLFGGYRVVLRDGRYLLLLLAATLAISIELQLIYHIAVRLGTDFPTQPLLPSLGTVTGPEVVGILRAENTLLVVILAPMLAPLLRHVPDGWRLTGGLTVFTVGFAVLAVSTVAWILLLAVAVLTVGELTNVPVKQTLIANAAGERVRGSYLAAYGLTGNAGWIIATAAIPLGAVAEPWHMAAGYLLCGGTAVVIFAWCRSRLGESQR